MIENILKIIDFILAIQIYTEELHLGAKDYQNHLLMERLGGGFDEHKDAIREISLQLFEGEYLDEQNIVSAKTHLKGALDIISLIPDEEYDYTAKVEYLKQIYERLLTIVNEANAPTQLRKQFDDLSAKLSRDIYLINQTLKGGKNDK